MLSDVNPVRMLVIRGETQDFLVVFVMRRLRSKFWELGDLRCSGFLYAVLLYLKFMYC